MSSLFFCPGCDTPLITKVELEKNSLYSSFLMSNLALQGGYALNFYREAEGCPICGNISQYTGNPIPILKEKIECKGNLEKNWIENIKRHTQVHFNHDWSFINRGDKTLSAHYSLTYSALRHFVFYGSLSTANPAIGLMALLSDDMRIDCLKFLTDLVNNTSGSKFTQYQINVEAYPIKSGSCLIITLPFPQRPPEAHFIGVVTNERLDQVNAQKPSDKIEILFFTLEHTDVNKGSYTILGEWTNIGRKRSYGAGPNPKNEDFVECLERIWVSEIWKNK